MTNTATAPPPVDAELGGPISEQSAGAESQRLLPSGGTGAQMAAQESTAAQPSAEITPAQGTSTAQGAAQATQGVNPNLASTIATAISLGLAQPPSSAAGWAQLAQLYSTPAGQNAVNVAQTTGDSQVAGSPTPAQGHNGNTSNAATDPNSPQGLNAFLGAIRQHESGGDYTAYNSGGGASGAYQFIQSTWTANANEAGYGTYANMPAGDAPPAVQDAVAAHMASKYFSQYGSWQNAAEAWYDPALVGQNVVPAPGAGNTETVSAYGQQIVQAMGQQANVNASHPLAGATNNIVSIAKGQLGTPYVWGGESAGHAFDCSGLVQWTFGQAGVQLPRTAQEQYDATPKVANPNQLQPGDLLFFGGGTGSIEHVGIYIGEGKMIDAPHTGADVRIDNVFAPNGKALWANYVGATRPSDPGGASTTATGSQADQGIQQSQQQYGQILQSVTAQLGQLNATYPGMFDTTEAVMP